MSWFVLFFAIAVAVYVERLLIPIAPNPRIRVVFRWNYVNGVMMAIGNLHLWLKWVQVAFTLCMGIWAICFSHEILRIEEEEEKRRQILREKQEAERKAREEEAMRRWEERLRLTRLEYLATKGCPMGLDCDAMGSDGQGDCHNFKVCERHQSPFR